MKSPVIVGLICFITTISGNKNVKDKVLASNIDTVTLHAHKLTSARRVEPIPQLKCIGGNAQGFFEIETMRCKAGAQGYDSTDIQWACTAETGPNFKLGSTQVLCEGYEHPDDSYILKGSCGVEYRLILTEAGEMKYLREQQHNQRHLHQTKSEGRDVAAVAFMILFAAVACFIFYKMYQGWRDNTQGQRTERRLPGYDDDVQPHSYSSDDSSDDDNDAPPPYSESSPHSGATKKSPGASLAAGAGVASAVGLAGAAARTYHRNSRLQQSNDNGEGSSRAGVGSPNPRPSPNAQAVPVRQSSPEVGRLRQMSPRRTWSNNSHTSQTSESTGFGGTTRR